ncbi:condensation domain-containing protein, partial [Paenibacillus sp. Leaf72]|uniref:condensation domain-containing protein n=1 Tax=Paenibacillus sp. Leaf72 TaxID=1736234 RepID=UPI0022853E78
MRVAVFRTGKHTHELVWSFHHIVMDGWCLPLVMEEVLRTYSAYSMSGSEEEQQEQEQPKGPAYSAYIRWLSEQDEASALRYWKERLSGCEAQAVFPKRQRQTSG